MLSRAIKDKVEKKYGGSVRYPVECDALAEAISKTTGRSISSSTIKRLWGFIDGASAARSYTLDTIAEYCGYSCFDDLIDSFNPLGEKAQIAITKVTLENLTKGGSVEVGLGNEGTIRLRYLGSTRFEVTESSITSLEKGQHVSLLEIETGLPLFLTSKSEGATTLAKLSGVTSIRMENLS